MSELRRRLWWAAGLLVLALVGFDLSRDPGNQWSARTLLWSIDAYQATVSPHLPKMGMRCRFVPTCSHYGEGAIQRYGALVGTARAAWRVLRCGPWTELGTVDPP